jgi:serine/threonine-protein phosphatase 2B catalytic subunit
MQSQYDKAVRQIQARQAAPSIDFTQHRLEDGNTVSTQERFVKDVGHYDLSNPARS